jgi:hypothetical protein
VLTLERLRVGAGALGTMIGRGRGAANRRAVATIASSGT